MTTKETAPRVGGAEGRKTGESSPTHDSRSLARVLRQLSGFGHPARRCGVGWVALCPAHPDRIPSLSVGVGDDGRVLVHCHAGCSAAEVVAALGLRMADLFPAASCRTGEGEL